MSGEYVMCVAVAPSAVNYTRPLLEIELNFDHCRAFAWLSAHWTVCYLLIGAYLGAIFLGRKWMAPRPPFRLQSALLFWNTALAVFSAVGAWRLLTALDYSVRRYGLFATSCTMGQPEQRQAIALWLFLFIFSKIVEFGDTVFIVLRKTPLIFLHWYHHVTVAFFVWSAGAYASPMQTYFTAINLLVHAVMYSYYVLKALRIRVPKAISKAITALQMLQMVAGMLITGYMVYVRAADPSCQVAVPGLAIAAAIYSSYFALFFSFFRRNYGSASTASKKLT